MLKQPVLFISPQPFFEWRGSSIRVKFNVMALSELGYDVHLLTLPVGKDDPAITARVIRAWNLFGTRQISIGPSLLKLWFDLILLLQGTYLVTRYRYRVLHGTEEAGFLSYLLSFICRARCIYEKHSDSGSYGGGMFKRMMLSVYSQVEKLTIRRADMVICTGTSPLQLSNHPRRKSKTSAPAWLQMKTRCWSPMSDHSLNTRE
jgi:hypothetical protein